MSDESRVVLEKILREALPSELTSAIDEAPVHKAFPIPTDS